MGINPISFLVANLVAILVAQLIAMFVTDPNNWNQKI